MPANTERKYRQIIDYIEDQVGADINRDLIRVAIDGIDDPDALDELPINLEEINGTEQTGANLTAILESVTASDDEVRVSLYAEDDGGNLNEIQGEELGTALAGTETAFITKTSEILETVGNTEARVSLYAEDDAGNLAEVQAEELGTTLAGAETAVVTKVVEALETVGNTELRTSLYAEDDAANLAEVQGEELDTAAGGTETALFTYLSRALNDIGQDELVSRVAGTDGVQIAEEQLDTGAAATDVGLITYLARALQSIDQDELNTTTATRDEYAAFDTGVDVNAATATEQFDVTPAMDTVTVSVDDADGAYHVEIAFQDGAGNDVTVRDETNNSSYAGDATTDVFIDTEIAYTQVEVRIVDDSAAANTLDYTVRAN